jgi:hypothetical protein
VGACPNIVECVTRSEPECGFGVTFSFFSGNGCQCPKAVL